VTATSCRAGGATNAQNQLIELFPDTAIVEDGELAVGGVRASALADEYGTPLVVYCRDTVLARARAYARVDPEALVVYGTKAFPNVALLRLLAAEGLGADVSTRGELEFALRAGVLRRPDRLPRQQQVRRGTGRRGGCRRSWSSSTPSTKEPVRGPPASQRF